MSLDMNDFGGEENIDALNVLLGEVTDGEGAELLPEGEEPLMVEGEAPTESELLAMEEQPQAQPEVQPEAQPVDPTIPPQPAQPEVDTNAILQQIQAQNEAIMGLQQQQQQVPAQPEAPAPELTEEEQALEELKERMGLNDMAKENEALKQEVEMQKQQNAMKEQEAYQAKVQSDISSLKAEHKGFDENLIAKELQTMAQQLVVLPNGQIARDENGNPINQAMMHDNKEGWAKIWNEKFAQAEAPAPDPIVPVNGGQAPLTKKDAMGRIKNASSTLEQGEVLLDIIGG